MWYEAGMCHVSSAGVGRLTWQEIDAWVNRCHTLAITDYVEIDNGVFQQQATVYVDLADWEIAVVRMMSSEYAGEYNAAKEAGRAAPYMVEQEVEDIDREGVANKVSNIFAGIKTKKQPRYEVEQP